MAELLINNWGGGIGDDPFLSRPGECLDMDGIDIRTTPRRITCAETSSGIYATDTLSASGETLNYITETIDGIVQSYGTNCYINSIGINPLCAGANAHITVGSNLQDYDSVTNPEGVRHIFFTYNGSTNPIKLVGYAGGVRVLGSGGAGLIQAPVNTSGGAAPANIPASQITTALCYLWKGALIFARGSKIYEINPETAVLSIGAKVELPVGAVVKYITFQGGLINFVYTINNDTYIHGCTFDGTNYKLYPYADKTAGEKCIMAVANGASIYWISAGGIFQYNGNSQLVKKYTFSVDAKCSFNKGILRIGDGVNVYEFGIQKPGYGSPFTKKAIVGAGLSIKGISENYILTFRTTGNQYKIDQFGGGYKAVNTWISHPYTAGQFGIDKKGLGIRIGYFLPRGTYIDPAIQCSITVAIQTKDMELTEVYTTIATITDKNETSRTIMLSEIANILGLASFSEEFPLSKIKLTLNAGDAFSGTGNTIFRKTPEVYDIYLTHDEIKQSI